MGGLESVERALEEGRGEEFFSVGEESDEEDDGVRDVSSGRKHSASTAAQP